MFFLTFPFIEQTEFMGRKARSTLAQPGRLESQKLSGGGRSVFLDFSFYRTYQALSRATLWFSVRLVRNAHHTVNSLFEPGRCRRLSLRKSLVRNAGRNHLASEVWKLRPRIFRKLTPRSYWAWFPPAESKPWNSHFGEEPGHNDRSDVRRDETDSG